MRTLDVYLGENLIGHITENRKGARFEYHANVVERFAGRPVLSLSFPAKVRAFGEEKLRIGLTGCFLKVIGVMRFAAV